MHQNNPLMPRLRRWTLSVLLLVAGGARAEEQPSPAMMEPVRALTAFMETLRPQEHAPMLAAKGLCIVENFAPFLFCGPGAAEAWEKGFRTHAATLTGLAAHFSEAYDFSVEGNRAYFSLPTVWTGFTHGRSFEEHGAWAFVVQREGPVWRIIGYGWAVYAYTEGGQ